MSRSPYRRTGRRKMTQNSHRIEIKLVESSIKNSEGYPTEHQLWHSLSHKIQRTALKKILIQLKTENKIIYDKKDGSIIWTFADTPEAQRSLKESVLLR